MYKGAHQILLNDVPLRGKGGGGTPPTEKSAKKYLTESLMQSNPIHTTKSGLSSLRAESARAADSALTVGRGKTFWRIGQVFFFFTKTAITHNRKVEKMPSRWEINSFSEGYKWAVDKNWCRMAKIRFFGQKPRFLAQKKHSLLNSDHVLFKEHIARIANVVQVTVCLLVSTSVY